MDIPLFTKASSRLFSKALFTPLFKGPLHTSFQRPSSHLFSKALFTPLHKGLPLRGPLIGVFPHFTQGNTIQMRGGLHRAIPYKVVFPLGFTWQGGWGCLLGSVPSACALRRTPEMIDINVRTNNYSLCKFPFTHYFILQYIYIYVDITFIYICIDITFIYTSLLISTITATKQKKNKKK